MFQAGAPRAQKHIPELTDTVQHSVWRCLSWPWLHVLPRVSSSLSFLGAAQCLLQLLGTDLIKHPRSVGCLDRWHECFMAFDTSLACFSHGLFQFTESPAVFAWMGQLSLTTVGHCVFAFIISVHLLGTKQGLIVKHSFIWLLLNFNLYFLLSVLSVSVLCPVTYFGSQCEKQTLYSDG